MLSWFQRCPYIHWHMDLIPCLTPIVLKMSMAMLVGFTLGMVVRVDKQSLQYGRDRCSCADQLLHIDLGYLG